MELNYKQDENGMLIPDLQAPPKLQPVGRFGRMRRDYLYQNLRWRYDEMLLEGTLNQHLQETDSRANERLALLTEQMERDNPPSETYTTQERMTHLLELHSEAEQMVLSEIVFQR